MNERIRPRAPWLAQAVLYAVIFVLFLPILVMALNSFLEQTDDGFRFGLRWYREVLMDRQLLESVSRSLSVALTSSLIATVIGSLSAVAVARTSFRFNRALTGFSMLCLIIPELVFALALLSWFYVLALPLSLTTVVIAHVTFCLSFVMMTVGSRAQALDFSIEDAARDLGAGEALILAKIILPLISMSMLTAFLLAFLLSFDDFLISFYTNGVGTDTLPIRLYTALKTGLSPRLSALATLMCLFSSALALLILQLNSAKK